VKLAAKSLRCGARFSFADLKGDLDSIGELAGGFAWRDGGQVAACGAARKVALSANEIGAAGRSRAGLRKFKFRQDVFLPELGFDPVCVAYRAAKEARRYEPCRDSRRWARLFLLLPDGTHFSML
jgi:hypothetical protein